jgi:uncharacterized protein (DUF1330 family)
MKQYAADNGPIYKKFGGQYLVRSLKCEVPEGGGGARQIVVEFPDDISALACYWSSEYQENIKVRAPYSECDFVIVLKRRTD